MDILRRQIRERRENLKEKIILCSSLTSIIYRISAGYGAAYLEELDPELPLWKNVKTRILSPIPNKSLLGLKNADEALETKSIKFTKIDKWWHKDKEIDMVALNDQTKEILFAECKWQSKVNAKKSARNLQKKPSAFIGTMQSERKACYIREKF